MKTKMTADEVQAAFEAIAAKAGGERVEGVILREVVTAEGRWLNDDPTPISPKTAAEIVRKVVEAARPV
jgi:hypothetical protein